MTRSKAVGVTFWIVTALFCLEMIFTAYWEWFTPGAARAFSRLGFAASSFRVELSMAKILGVFVLLTPAFPARLKEWAYAGFAFNLLSALIAHASIHEWPIAFAPSAITLLLGVGSYLSWRRSEAVKPSVFKTLDQQAEARSDAKHFTGMPTGGYITR